MILFRTVSLRGRSPLATALLVAVGIAVVAGIVLLGLVLLAGIAALAVVGLVARRLLGVGRRRRPRARTFDPSMEVFVRHHDAYVERLRPYAGAGSAHGLHGRGDR